MTMVTEIQESGKWDGVERRRNLSERRSLVEPRTRVERRQDIRLSQLPLKNRIVRLVRSLAHVRLGVDRRKHERRYLQDRRRLGGSVLLSRDEIADLLSN